MLFLYVNIPALKLRGMKGEG